MNLHELDRYKLSDAVKFNARLNPRLWGKDEHLKPEVRDALIKIADDFRESLGVKDLDLKDITLSGSNAAYTYTPNSDIDLHLVVNMPDDPVYRELFDAKKYAYNNQHNIRIGGYDVELYVQDVDQPHVTQGEYSLIDNNWIQVPRRQRADVVDQSTKSKYQDLKQRIKAAIKTEDHEVLAGLMAKIKQLRQSGLDQHGEFGPENLAFKMLRTQGYIQRLVDARNAAKDQELSIDERVKPRVTYGFTTESEDSLSDTINQFAQSCIEYLGIEKAPRIQLHTDTDWSEHTGSFGQYEPETNVLHLATSGRHTLDILRTMAHEFTHRKQAEQQTLPADAGETGSPYEDEANAMAGRIMRHWAEKHPEMFASVPLEEASGYIPTKKQARDPRFVMALTRDVRPGQTGKEANKLGLQTDAQGHPALLTAMLKESLIQELDKYGNQDPTGPEFKPTMPKGTVRVDVSDVYDWYKLGKNIANLNKANPKDFGKGPPSTIVSFGDEETEHKYIKDLKKLGLTTTDIDPKDPNQPAGMPRQSTDPTYNVDEGKMDELDMDLEDSEISDKQFEKMYGMTRKEAREQFSQTDMWTFPELRDPNRPLHEQELKESLAAELREFKDQDLFEIKMSTANLRQEAAKTGALAGMEFEMIVPNVQGDPNDFESEPDYERDERCRSIEDAVQFFYDGDWNDRRRIDRLRERMNEDYLEWLDGKIESEWDDRGEEYIVEWVKNNVDEDEWNPDELEGDERNEALEEFAANVHADPMGDYYQQARDEFREEHQEDYDESDWLDAEDLDRMTGIHNAYDINWPYYTEPGDAGEAEISDVAQDFQDSIGRDTYAADSYHSSGTLRPGPSRIRYVVEPDGSLEPDNDGDRGLEFVSPPLPIDEILGDLNKVKKWAKAYGCYTNDSTGLHINISVPNYDRTKLDYVKLALLMGDKYVLDLFGRSGNTYARSAFDIVKRAVRDQPEEAAKLLDKMKGNLDQLATKAIHSGITSKYTSINTKDGHIEFRSPGGDWLDQNFDQIENTLLRFTVAMSAALNPEMYRKEYLTKLYKLLSENNKDVDTIKYFSDYVAGKIPRAALRSFVKQAQLERRLKRDPTGGPPVRPFDQTQSTGPTLNGRPSNPDGGWVISPENDRSRVAYRFAAASFDDANIVRRQWAADNDGVWIVQRDTNRTLGQPSSSQQPSSTGTYELFDRRTGEAIPDSEFTARNQREVNTRLQDYIDFGRHGVGQTDAQFAFGVRPVGSAGQITPTAPTQQGQGNWGIWLRNENRFSRAPDQPDNSVLRRFPSREAAEQFIQQGRENNPNMRTDIEVREIEPRDGFQFELSQTDIENRLGWGGQAADANYEVVNRATMQPVFRFIANTPEEANTKYAQILRAMGMPPETEDYGYRDIVVPGSTIDLQRRRASAAGSDNVFGISGQRSSRSDGSNINYSFRDLFGTNATADQQQGGIVDVAPNRAQNFGNQFSGQWRVVDGAGRELYVFRGVGNSQADANRIAATWARENNYSGALDVLPVMIEGVAEGISPDTIHKLADRKGIKWDNEPSFLALTKRLTGKAHLDDLDQTGLEKVKQYLDKPGVAEDQDLTEIENIPASMFAGGKDMLDYMPPPTKKRLKPLPGGTDLMYAIETMGPETRVQIVDPGIPGITRPDVVAVLNLDPVHYLPNTVQVGSITVDEDYRGRGLARALYGIVLTIMRKNLLSGGAQTPGGRKNWLSLAAIPGVEVHGLVRIPNQVFDMNQTAVVSPGYQKYADRVMDQVMQLGGQFFSKNNNSTYWLFDVVPGKGSLQPAVKNSLSKLYGYDADNLLLARWSGA